MTEHAYEPARQEAPYMCLCGNAYRTREEVRAHVKHPEPERVVWLPRYIAPADVAPPVRTGYRRKAA